MSEIIIDAKRLDSFTKIGQLFSYTPRMLQYFRVKNENIQIGTKNGAAFEAPLAAITSSLYLGKHKRQYFKVKSDTNRISFFINPYILSDQERDFIICTLKPQKGSAYYFTKICLIFALLLAVVKFGLGHVAPLLGFSPLHH